jgi:hypothetical protein
MADTGAPWNIPYAEPADLVRDWPALSEDVADAVAAGLSAAGGLVAVKYAIRTAPESFSSGTTWHNIGDLSITHEVSDPSNRLIITGTVGVGSTDASGVVESNYAIAVFDGTNRLALGDAPTGVAVTSGGKRHGNLADASHNTTLTIVHTPGSGSKTYTLQARAVTTAELFINRTRDDGSSSPRGVSTLTIMEVKV